MATARDRAAAGWTQQCVNLMKRATGTGRGQDRDWDRDLDGKGRAGHIMYHGGSGWGRYSESGSAAYRGDGFHALAPSRIGRWRERLYRVLNVSAANRHIRGHGGPDGSSLYSYSKPHRQDARQRKRLDGNLSASPNLRYPVSCYEGIMKRVDVCFSSAYRQLLPLSEDLHAPPLQTPTSHSQTLTARQTDQTFHQTIRLRNEFAVNANLPPKYCISVSLLFIITPPYLFFAQARRSCFSLLQTRCRRPPCTSTRNRQTLCDSPSLILIKTTSLQIAINPCSTSCECPRLLRRFLHYL